MPSTFFGLNIGANALFAYNTAVNTTANNIANVQTTGYTRQTTNIESTAALRVNTRYGSVGTGAEAVSITQDRNEYYDTKYWENESSLGKYEQKLYYLDQVQSIFQDDDVQEGFTTIFNKMFNALDTLKNNASDISVRNQFINTAQSLATYFNNVSESLKEIQEDCNEEIKNSVESINAIAQKISLINKQINQLELGGGTACELRDERANLLDTLSSIVNVETIETEVQNTNGANLGQTNFVVTINGQVLVDGNDYYQLECVSSDFKNNQMDADGLYTIVWADTGMDFAATSSTAGGSLKALFEMRDGNNADNLKGSFDSATTGADGNSILKITDVSNVDVNALTLAENGKISVNNRQYDYTSWEAELDADGNITSVSFYLTEPIKYNINQGDTVTVGTTVDSMGIPYYQAQLNEFLRNFATAFNDLEQSGQDLNGDQMTTFFQAMGATGTLYDFDAFDLNASRTSTTISSSDDTYYKLTAATVLINEDSLRDATKFSTAADITNGTDAYDIAEKLLDLQSNVTMYRGDVASSFLTTLLSDVTVDTQKAEIFYNNYSNMESTISNLRISVSGVDEDEEALDLIKFQNAYNLASKVISVMDEMYDRLINETGVT